MAITLGRRKHHRNGNPNRSRSSATTSTRRGPSSVTGAGFRITRRDTDSLRRLILPWQTRAFAYYDMLGEIKYAAHFYARMLGPLRLYVEELNEKGEWVESKDAEAIDALERIQDPGGIGRTGLLSQYGILMFLTGEGYLLCTLDPDTEQEQWEMLSTDELRPVGDGNYIRYRAPSLPAEELTAPEDDEESWEALDPAVAFVYRIWQPHPRYSMQADSTMEGVLELCEELVLLTQAVRARARSRLAGTGVLFLSEDFSHAPLESVPGEDPNEDPFLSDLTDAMTRPIADEGSASAVVPLVVRGPTSAIKEGIKHLQIVDPMQVYPETGLRYELVKRIAIGLDMPPEQLLGLTDANHWSGWMIDEQTWKNHGMPKAIQLCNDLNQSYFGPYLREQLGREDWQRFRIGFDPSTVINHPDRTKDAKELFTLNIVGPGTVREAAGFSDDDAPTPEESYQRVGILTHDPSLAWDGKPSVKTGGVETAPGEIVTGADSAPPGATGANDVAAGPPPAGPPDPAAASNGHRPESELRHVEMFSSRVIGAADLALHRARQIAGNRLKGYAKRDDECLSLIDGARATQVAAILGRERVRSLKVPSERELVSGVHDEIRETLRLYGIEDEAVAEAIAAHVEMHAARTLYDEQPPGLPASFQDVLTGILLGAREPALV